MQDVVGCIDAGKPPKGPRPHDLASHQSSSVSVAAIALAALLCASCNFNSAAGSSHLVMVKVIIPSGYRGIITVPTSNNVAVPASRYVECRVGSDGNGTAIPGMQSFLLTFVRDDGSRILDTLTDKHVLPTDVAVRYPEFEVEGKLYYVVGTQQDLTELLSNTSKYIK